MDNYMRPRNGASKSLLPGLFTNIATDLTTLKANLNKKDQTTWDQWNNLHNSISTYYGIGGNGAGELDWSVTWEWIRTTLNAKNSKTSWKSDMLRSVKHVLGLQTRLVAVALQLQNPARRSLIVIQLLQRPQQQRLILLAPVIPDFQVAAGFPCCPVLRSQYP